MDTYVLYAPDCKRQLHGGDNRLEVPRTREALLAIRAPIDAELQASAPEVPACP